eukprot:10827186-Prorocentrum_lima.AAC.1
MDATHCRPQATLAPHPQHQKGQVFPMLPTEAQGTGADDNVHSNDKKMVAVYQEDFDCCQK